MHRQPDGMDDMPQMTLEEERDMLMQERMNNDLSPIGQARLREVLAEIYDQ